MNTETLKQKIAAAERQLAEAKAELEALENPKLWEPAFGGRYWMISLHTGLALRDTRLKNSHSYRTRKSLGLVFRTEEEARQHLDQWQARVRIEQRIAELDCGKKLGKKRKRWYGLWHSRGVTGMAGMNTISCTQPPALCGTEETIKQVIREHEDDYKIYFGVK